MIGGWSDQFHRIEGDLGLELVACLPCDVEGSIDQLVGEDWLSVV